MPCRAVTGSHHCQVLGARANRHLLELAPSRRDLLELAAMVDREFPGSHAKAGSMLRCGVSHCRCFLACRELEATSQADILLADHTHHLQEVV